MLSVKDLEGSGRCLTEVLSPDVCLEELRKIMKVSLMIEGTAAEIQALELPSASLGHAGCASLLGPCAPSAKLRVTTLLNFWCQCVPWVKQLGGEADDSSQTVA
jgi:hypothetical protein